jgi:hypothetical protein
MKNETAIEWLWDKVYKDYEENGRLRYAYISNVFIQAKEMEKEQELKEWSAGYDSGFNNGMKKFKQQIT